MNVHSKLVLAVVPLALLTAQPTLAKPINPSASWAGTWKLDVGHSKFSGPADKSETRTYTINGNKVTFTSKGVNAAGKPVNFSYDAAYDGKWYPMVGNPRGDQISLSLVNSRLANAKVRMKGKVTVTASLKVSPDGKHLTLNRRMLNAKGGATVDVLAYDKVP